jgi:hypothetical protein
MTLNGVWGAFVFHPALNWAGCLLHLLISPLSASPPKSRRWLRFDTRVAQERPVSGSGVEPRFGIRFVSSYMHGRETHQSRQIAAADRTTGQKGRSPTRRDRERAINTCTDNGPTVLSPIEQQIQQRAYELYEQRGRTDGHDLDDWLQAECEIKGTQANAAAA